MTTRHLVTMTYAGAGPRVEAVRVHTATFLVADVAHLECTLDAAWTAFQERRVDQAMRLLGEVVLPSEAAWWMMHLPGCIRPPRVGSHLVGTKPGAVVIDDAYMTGLDLLPDEPLGD